MKKSNELKLSLRETRMLLERIFQHTGIPDGVLFSVRDTALYAVALGLTPAAQVLRQLPALARIDLAAMRLTGDGEHLRIDAGGQHAWAVAESALDLAIDRFRRNAGGEVHVTNVAEPKQLGVVAGLAEAHGLSATATEEAGGVRIRVAPRDFAQQTVLDRIRREGIPATYAAWLELLESSKKALAEDSPLSRTHNGDIMVKPDGTVVGRRDEEYADMDISLLVNAGFEGNAKAPQARKIAEKESDAH